MLFCKRIKTPLMTSRLAFLIFLTSLIYCLSCVNSPVFSYDSLREQASEYRNKGFEAQIKGDNRTAATFYKKAIEIDPTYSIAYNDLGIVYEKLDLPFDAEEMYKLAIELDPHYLAAYTNLALFYEKRKDYQQAARLWSRRIELGEPTDPWTIKAKEHLENLAKTDKNIYKIYEQTETLSIIDDVKGKKQDIKDSNQLAAEVYFQRGKELYEQGQYIQALRQLHRASNLDPRNKEIEDLLIQTQKRALLMP
ncbi:MAG: tetratricopeptide repeat protein [Candidatus Omnitrophota bacterium]